MAVYTKVSDTEAAEFLRAYDLGAFKELTGIAQGVENSNYRLRTTQGHYILTLYEKRTKVEDLPFFLGLMEYMAQKNLPCPLPMRAKTGETILRLVGRPAVITSALPGVMTPKINPEQCAELGRVLAAMHGASVDFALRRPNALGLTGWEKLFADCGARADEVKPGLGEILGNELALLRAGWPRDLPWGVIHADLFHDNTLYRGDTLCGVIDFYFACEDFYAYDLAICLNAWCFERDTFNVTKARALLKGYEDRRPLSPGEKAALPLLARGASLRFLLTRLYDWLHRVPGALVKPKDPLEYLTRLQFHQHVTGISAYGIDP